jgi:hypothetical protein
MSVDRLSKFGIIVVVPVAIFFGTKHEYKITTHAESDQLGIASMSRHQSMNYRDCVIFCQDRYSFRLFDFNDFFVEAEWWLTVAAYESLSYGEYVPKAYEKNEIAIYGFGERSSQSGLSKTRYIFNVQVLFKQ